MSTPVIFHNMSNYKNNEITDYKTDNITTNVLRLVANQKSNNWGGGGGGTQRYFELDHK